MSLSKLWSTLSLVCKYAYEKFKIGILYKSPPFMTDVKSDIKPMVPAMPVKYVGN